jgi:alcohol dehydrogenase class IV
MKPFNFHQTTKIIFGSGKIAEIADTARQFGRKALLVTTPAANSELEQQYQRVSTILKNGGVEVIHFAGVVPNPTVESISNGAKMAREAKVDMIIGLGGGSSMDSAKAISVEATHPGSSWDYLFYKEQPDPKKLLPVIAVSTTSGTGSQVTQVAVITNPSERDKSALYNNILYPQVCIIDPELMLTVPEFVTACTGFDVFCHSFESIIHPGSSAYTDMMAWNAIELVAKNLPKLVNHLDDVQLREKMAWADTLAGLCIANAGVTLPHGIGMAIGGMYPHVAHGEALAIVYPAFAEYTSPYDTSNFAKLVRILNPELAMFPESEVAMQSKAVISGFLKMIGLNIKLSQVNIPEQELPALAKQSMVLPDYQNNPKVATETEMLQLLRDSF